MKPQFIFSFLRIATSILFILMIVLTSFVIFVGVMSFTGFDVGPGRPQFKHEVITFEAGQARAETVFSPDSLVLYTPIVGRYQLEVKPNSSLGYYSYSVLLLSFLLVVAILGVFRRIFREADVQQPFKHSIFKRLITLAILFVVMDLLKLIHYGLFGKLVNSHLTGLNFELVLDIGNGFITSLIISAIAIIYQRGIMIQEENALTV